MIITTELQLGYHECDVLPRFQIQYRHTNLVLVIATIA